MGSHTVATLLPVISPLPLRKRRCLACLVLRHFVNGVLPALLRLAVSATRLGDVDHGSGLRVRPTSRMMVFGLQMSVTLLPGKADKKYSGWLDCWTCGMTRLPPPNDGRISLWISESGWVRFHCGGRAGKSIYPNNLCSRGTTFSQGPLPTTCMTLMA